MCSTVEAVSPERDATQATLVASRALLGMVARSLAPALEKVSIPQFRVLVVLSAEGPQRMGDLAERIGVHPSTLTRTVERLEHGGWITRAPVPGNRREIRVDLTGTGEELVATVTTKRREQIYAALSTLSADEREALRRGMELFSTAAGEPDPADLLELGL